VHTFSDIWHALVSAIALVSVSAVAWFSSEMCVSSGTYAMLAVLGSDLALVSALAWFTSGMCAEVN
jgi:hypothetical protein